MEIWKKMWVGVFFWTQYATYGRAQGQAMFLGRAYGK